MLRPEKAPVPAGCRNEVRIASADGFVTSTMRIEKDHAGEALFTLSRGYRVIASAEFPAADAGPNASASSTATYTRRSGEITHLRTSSHRRSSAGTMSVNCFTAATACDVGRASAAWSRFSMNSSFC